MSFYISVATGSERYCPISFNKTSFSSSIQDIKSIELRRGLVYHVYNAVVEMSSALPVEDRLVIFDAWRLPEPLECDHHCVRYMGINVSLTSEMLGITSKLINGGYFFVLTKYPLVRKIAYSTDFTT